ncbi:hypothetical protein ACFWF7_30210 [Nocardia sp. NPDC060256]|uniref:hypothetical protein n=1 Tax=unclassified Nocardia TaxID=2637762 RepID=UPI0036479337
MLLKRPDGHSQITWQPRSVATGIRQARSERMVAGLGLAGNLPKRPELPMSVRDRLETGLSGQTSSSGRKYCSDTATFDYSDRRMNVSSNVETATAGAGRAATTRRGQHLPVLDAGHSIQLHKPAAVTDAIHRIVDHIDRPLTHSGD